MDMGNTWSILKGVVLLNVLTLCLVSSTYFGITTDLYSGFLPAGSAKVVASIDMMPRNTEDQMNRARMLCNRRCVHNERCKAHYVDNYLPMLRCFLLDSNLCLNTPLNPNYGWLKNFDKITDASSPVPCIGQCAKNHNGDCGACYRPGCIGNDCSTCNQICRDCYNNFPASFSPAGEAKCTLWAGDQIRNKITAICVQAKLLMYRRFNYPNGTTINDAATSNFAWGSVRKHLQWNTQKYMLIELYSSAGTVYTALYSGFSCDHLKRLTLGSFVNGTAGDGLYAPFSNIPFVENATLFDPACGGFWNISQSPSATLPLSKPFNATGPCPGGLTAFFGSPKTTGGVFWSGIAWSTLPAVKLIGIRVYLI